MHESKIELLEKTPVHKTILKLAIPTMLGMAIQLIYNMTDTYFIGKTGDPNLVAAISLAAPLFMAIQAIGNIFAIGTSSYISRKLGEKEYHEAKHASSVATYTAVGIGVFITALSLCFRKELLGMIGTSSATLEPTSEYLTVILTFSPMFILQMAISGLIRSEGATDKAMAGMFIGIGTNIVLDPIFILVLKMGTLGAAWATAIGNMVGLVYYFMYFLKGKTLISVKLKDFKPSKIIYWETFKIGVPSAAGSLVMSISMVLVNILASSYGDHVVAGNGIQMRVVGLVIMLAIGLAQGFQPFAGYNYGAKQYDRLKKGFKTTMLYGTLLSLFFTIVFILFGENLISLFINDEKTVSAGVAILKAFIWCVPFFGIQMTLMVTFQSTGKAMQAMIISLGRQCIVYLPLLFILNSLFGFSGFIYAQPLADIITTVVAIVMSISFLKEMNSLHQKEMNLTAQYAQS